VTKSQQGETSKFVLGNARAAGFQVSEDQLTGWHRDGLIPRPQQRWTEGIAGSQTVYPIGTANQLCALCAIQTENRSSAMIWGWKLWWLGFPVDKKYWRLKLRAQAQLLDSTSRKLIRLLGADQDNDRYEDAVTVLRTRRTRNAPFRRLRRRLVAGHFEGMLSVMIQILEGNFRGWSIAPSDDVDALRDRMMIDRLFGLRRAKNVHEVAHDRAMHDDIEEALHLLSNRLGETKLESVLESTSDSQLAEARTQLRVMLFTAGGIDESSVALARHGIQVLKELAQQMGPGDQATFLLYLLALKQSPMVQKDVAVFLHALRRHVPKSISDAQVGYLRSRDPVICSFAFPE
jgi:hypothetical protein